MRLLLSILLIISGSFCYGQSSDEQLLKHLQILAADDMQGRMFGTNIKAQDYIVEQFSKLKLKPAFENGYRQPFEHKGKKGNNIVAVIPGTSKSTIVVTAHFDHLGSENGKIYNGADDNASGSAALFSIAEHFKKSAPHHTLLLAAVDAEEIGSIGAQYLLDNFPGSADDIVLNVNLDMIAHNDNKEIYACGTYFYPQLKLPLTKIETSIDIKFGHDSPEYKGADNWTYASDHRVFHRKKIPFVYFGVEDHKDYHQPTDTYDQINQDFYLKTVDLIVKALESYDEKLR